LDPPCQRCGGTREAEQIKLEDPMCHKCGQKIVKEATRNPDWDRFSVGWFPPGDLPLPVERNGRHVVDIPNGEEAMAKRAADAYREQMKQADAQRDAAIAKLGQLISEMPGVTEDVLRETLADIQSKTKDKP
jgi:hypothetical protein